MALSGASSGETSTKLSANHTLDLAFACQTCGLSPLVSANQSSNEDLIRISPAADPETTAVTAAVWALECGHVFCKDHVGATAVPFFPSDEPPMAVCPTCLQAGDSNERGAAWLNGLEKGRYDERFAIDEFKSVIENQDPYTRVLVQNLALAASFWKHHAERLRRSHLKRKSRPVQGFSVAHHVPDNISFSGEEDQEINGPEIPAIAWGRDRKSVSNTTQQNAQPSPSGPSSFVTQPVQASNRGVDDVSQFASFPATAICEPGQELSSPKFRQMHQASSIQQQHSAHEKPPAEQILPAEDGRARNALRDSHNHTPRVPNFKRYIGQVSPEYLQAMSPSGQTHRSLLNHPPSSPLGAPSTFLTSPRIVSNVSRASHSPSLPPPSSRALMPPPPHPPRPSSNNLRQRPLQAAAQTRPGWYRAPVGIPQGMNTECASSPPIQTTPTLPIPAPGQNQPYIQEESSRTPSIPRKRTSLEFGNQTEVSSFASYRTPQHSSQHQSSFAKRRNVLASSPPSDPFMPLPPPPQTRESFVGNLFSSRRSLGAASASRASKSTRTLSNNAFAEGLGTLQSISRNSFLPWSPALNSRGSITQCAPSKSRDTASRSAAAVDRAWERAARDGRAGSAAYMELELEHIARDNRGKSRKVLFPQE